MPAGAPLTTSVLQTTNEAFDFAASRRAALDARVPGGVLAMLAVFATLTAAIMGYGLATQPGAVTAWPPAASLSWSPSPSP